MNVRHEEKAVFDLLQSWWSLRAGATVKQWDAFALLVQAALSNPAADLPDELRELSRPVRREPFR